MRTSVGQDAVGVWRELPILSLAPGQTYRLSIDGYRDFGRSDALDWFSAQKIPQAMLSALSSGEHLHVFPGSAPPSDWPGDDRAPGRVRMQFTPGGPVVLDKTLGKARGWIFGTALPPSPTPGTGMGTALCDERDLPPNLVGLLQSLRQNPAASAELLEQWAFYFDSVCPLVGAGLHEVAFSKRLAALR